MLKTYLQFFSVAPRYQYIDIYLVIDTCIYMTEEFYYKDRISLKKNKNVK